MAFLSFKRIYVKSIVFIIGFIFLLNIPLFSIFLESSRLFNGEIRKVAVKKEVSNSEEADTYSKKENIFPSAQENIPKHNELTDHKLNTSTQVKRKVQPGKWLFLISKEFERAESLDLLGRTAFKGCFKWTDTHAESWSLDLPDAEDCALFCLGRDFKIVHFVKRDPWQSMWAKSYFCHCSKLVPKAEDRSDCSADADEVSGVFQIEPFIRPEDSGYLQSLVAQPGGSSSFVQSSYRGCLDLRRYEVIPDDFGTEAWIFIPTEECISHCDEKGFTLALSARGEWCACINALKYTSQSYKDILCTEEPFDYVRQFVTSKSRDICGDAKLAPKNHLPAIGIISTPGSGNTWSRFSIEQMSGISTGSIYHDGLSFSFGLKGEMENIHNGNTIAIKSHWLCHQDNFFLENCVKNLNIIRNPLRTAISNYNLKAGKLKHLDLNKLSSEDFRKRSDGWHFEMWRNLGKQFYYNSTRPFLVISYEDMVETFVIQMMRIRKFLNVTTPESLDRIFCSAEIQKVGDGKKRVYKEDPMNYVKFNSTLYAQGIDQVTELYRSKHLHILRDYKAELGIK